MRHSGVCFTVNQQTLM